MSLRSVVGIPAGNTYASITRVGIPTPSLLSVSSSSAETDFMNRVPERRPLRAAGGIGEDR